MTWGLTLKREGFFENAFTFDVKFIYNSQNCFLIPCSRENQQGSGEGGEAGREPERRNQTIQGACGNRLVELRLPA